MDTSIRLSDLVTVVAVVAGPIFAVQVQTFLERRRERRDRKLKVFRTLMATRARKAADPTHVEALNLISIDFYTDKPVTRAWGIYLDHLNTRSSDTNAWGEKMSDLFEDLMVAMAGVLNFDFDKVQIKRQSYSPVLVENMEKDAARIREGVISVLEGQSAILVHSGNQTFTPAKLPNPMTAVGAAEVTKK